MNKNTLKFEDETLLEISKDKNSNDIEYVGISLESSCMDTFSFWLNKKELAILIENLKLYL